MFEIKLDGKGIKTHFCGCGGYFRYGNKARHFKTKIHITHIHNQAGGN